ncbi:MAG: sulfite exporter TauE/SafE family protein [Desulfuromonadaceae bacterium]
MSLLAPQIILLFVLLGSLAGLLAGLLGIGGGIILVPMFLWVFKHAGFSPDITVHAAFGTSLCIIIPTAISSTLGHRKRGNVDWHHVMRLALGGIFGALLGAALAAQLSGIWLIIWRRKQPALRRSGNCCWSVLPVALSRPFSESAVGSLPFP